MSFENSMEILAVQILANGAKRRAINEIVKRKRVSKQRNSVQYSQGKVFVFELV